MNNNNAGDRLFEKKLGYINPETKKVGFYAKTNAILSGAHDNDPISESKFPIIAAMLKRIGKSYLVIS